jgi:SAM-dependent methyltransferase
VPQQPDTFASSTGQVMTGAGYLDNHFEAARPEYEAQLRAVGIQLGWRVLDAACGSGSFLPWLAELVGPSGHLSALDLAPDNVALVERRLADWQFLCPVEARVGTVLDLPYPDDAFDAVWLANTSQYLTNAELGTALAELRRVVRPGGLVAVKETDVTMYRVFPAPPGLILRWFQANADAGSVQSAGALRAPALPGWLRQAGLLDVWKCSTLIERTAPLGQVVRGLYHDMFRYLASLAAEIDLPAADREFWAQIGDSAALDHYLDDSDCWLVECNVLTVGTVPTGGKSLSEVPVTAEL